jgi:hypothetical protein
MTITNIFQPKEQFMQKEIDQVLVDRARAFLTAGAALLDYILATVPPEQARFVNDLLDRDLSLAMELVMNRAGKRAVLMTGLDAVGQRRNLFRVLSEIDKLPGPGWDTVPGKSEPGWVQ